MNLINIRTYILSALLLLNAACQPGADLVDPQGNQLDNVSAVEVLYSSRQCSYYQKEPVAIWVNDAEQLQAVIKTIRRDTLTDNDFSLPDVDFEKAAVLLIQMGQKTTLGYAIELNRADALTVKQGQAQVMLNWVQPSSGNMVAQMISSPCVLLKLQQGDYHSVQVLDQQGDVITETD